MKTAAAGSLAVLANLTAFAVWLLPLLWLVFNGYLFWAVVWFVILGPIVAYAVAMFVALPVLLLLRGERADG